MTTIICPVGDTYGTVKSHAHGCASGVQSGVVWGVPIDPDDDYILETQFGLAPVYVEVTPEQWALFAFNGRSMNVTLPEFSGLEPFTLWRSSRPDWSYQENNDGGYDEEVGVESSPVYVTKGTQPPHLPDILYFSPLPWIFAGVIGLNQPNPGRGVRTVVPGPKCYILDGKFYIGRQGTTGSNRSVTVSGNTYTYSVIPVGETDTVSEIYEITSTFYPIP